MEQQLQLRSYLVIWRGQKLIVEMDPSTSLKELGEKLQELTNVRADTLRLLVPMEKSSKMFYPFSDEHSSLRLETTLVLKGKSIRMMGVPKDEVDEILENAKVDLRIAGFEEEEKRLRQRTMYTPYTSRKLPQGNYIFCDFRTLSIPGIELNPPAAKALELLHMLASDPGIVAIMNKHRWRVGILTEMAPIGYVGISPKCILGFNKNCGEEISLRLRTDDLKGFRKYQSIKKTLLHELAHMIYSEHDANFYALDSQLNKEAATLDWTKSRGHSLAGVTHSQNYETEFENSGGPAAQKLGGRASILPNARASSVNAAFQRLANTSTPAGLSEEIIAEPDPDDSNSDFMELDNYLQSRESHVEVVPNNIQTQDPKPTSETENSEESNSNHSRISPVRSNFSEDGRKKTTIVEHKLDDSESNQNHMRIHSILEPDQMDSCAHTGLEGPEYVTDVPSASVSSDSETLVMQPKPDSGEAITTIQTTQPETVDPELQIIQDPVTIVCDRLEKAIQSLKYEVNPPEAVGILQTLIKIIRNAIEHPNEMKFKRLRKANSTIQRNVVRYKAAMDILKLTGFNEEVAVDEYGKAEDILILRRNDPGLLWLVKSSLESSIA